MHVRKLLELIISGLNETYSSVKFWRWKGRENMEGGGGVGWIDCLQDECNVYVHNAWITDMIVTYFFLV